MVKIKKNQIIWVMFRVAELSVKDPDRENRY